VARDRHGLSGQGRKAHLRVSPPPGGRGLRHPARLPRRRGPLARRGWGASGRNPPRHHPRRAPAKLPAHRRPPRPGGQPLRAHRQLLRAPGRRSPTRQAADNRPKPRLLHLPRRVLQRGRHPHRGRLGGGRLRHRIHHLRGLPHHRGGLRRGVQRRRRRRVRHQAPPGPLGPRLLHLPGRLRHRRRRRHRGRCSRGRLRRRVHPIGELPYHRGSLRHHLQRPRGRVRHQAKPGWLGPRLLHLLGGSDGDSGGVIAVDSAGAIDVIGDTGSADFPTTAGAFDTGYNGGGGDAFVTKLNPAGSDLAYSTYLGGSDIDVGWSIAVDSAGTRYVTGYTNSADFPTTAGAFDTSFNGGGIFGDAFVTKLNPGGSDLAYSTYLGGSDDDIGRGIAIDSAGAAYLTGDTESGDFPATAGAFDTSFNDTGRYFVGDAFVTKLNPAGSGLAYSTYLGGSSPEEGGFEIAVDSGGAAYVTGTTFSRNFPTTAGAFDTSFNGGFENGGTDAFVTKLNPAGSGLAYSTYLGGSDEDIGQGIAIDSAGAAYVTGYISSTDFPTTAGAFDTSFNGGFDDAFVTKLIPPPPTSIPRCKVTNGGRITAENGDVATFGGDARSDAAGHVQGQEQYRDHGPAEPQGVRSIRIQVLICNQARTQATILGQATIDGSGMHAYEIEVQDLGDPGKGVDTYRIALDTGYDSGLQTLAGGDVQIDKP